MMNRKVLPVILLVLLGGIFWAFQGNGKNKSDDAISKQQQLLAAIGNILEQKHYSPHIIDDSFSKKIFTKYLTSLDGDKDIFLNADIQSLKKYETTIDDEIHATQPLQFFPTAITIYKQRLKEASSIYKDILSTPFNFSIDEEVQLDGDKVDYPNNAAELKESWRKRLKYLTLERFTELQTQREKSKETDSIHNRSEESLESEARMRVKKSMDRNFERLSKTFSQEDQFSLFVNTITEAMDPHTAYFPPVEKRAFDEEMSGRFYGIGAQLKEEDCDIIIASLVTGSPAWKSGKIQINDAIIKVAQGNAEPVDITGYATTDAVKLIRGAKGTEVRLTLKKVDGTHEVVVMIRDEIVQDESFARSAIINQGGKKVGYIFLPEFYADFERPDGAKCSDDVAKEVKKLKDEHVEGIVLDLRTNGGGSLLEVVRMVGLFIKSGPVVQVKDKTGKPSVLDDDDESVLYNGPLAVMVNELSASASEIFAAAIQDYKRGIIIGSTSTYGKGTVQKTLPLGRQIDYFSGATEYGALKLTFEKFYRINGGSTQLKGVTPDIVLPDVYEYLKFREKDNPAALSWDQIPQATYSEWDSQVNWKKIINNAQDRIKSNTSFTAIKNNTNWLSKNIDKKFSLDIIKYKSEQEQIKNLVKQNENMLKLIKPLEVSPLAIDKERFYNNPDKAKGERYQAWIKNLKTDLYINETINIISDIAANDTSNIASH